MKKINQVVFVMMTKLKTLPLEMFGPYLNIPRGRDNGVS